MPILKVNDCSKGVNLDLTPEELQPGTWSTSSNMRFVNGYAQRFKGIATIFTAPSAIPYFITPFQTALKRYWVHASTANVFAKDGTTRTDITPATAPTGSSTDRWSAASFGAYLVMTNGVDVPYSWDGNTANKLVNLVNWTSTWRCASIHTFKGYVVALDITKGAARYQHMVKWSHAAVPGSLPSSWDETDVTKDAGENEISETPDAIVDAMQLGDSYFIYKERSIYRMTFIGYPYIFSFQRMPTEHGMLIKGCGVTTPVGHVVLTSGDVVVNDGQSVQSIADGQVRKYIFDNISTSNYKKAFVCANPQKNEVLICFPFGSSTYCNKALVWNWASKAWGSRDLTNATFGASGQIENISAGTWSSDSETWALDSSVWNENEYSPNEARLLFAEASRISAFDVSSGDDGVTPLTGSLERIGMSFDDAYTNKLIRCVYPRIDAPNKTPVTIQVGGSMFPDAAVTWSAPVTFTVGSSVKADCFASGRYLALRISASAPYRIRSFDIDIVKAGAY